MARDWEAEILHWALVQLDAWGGSLRSAEEWASRFNDPRNGGAAYQYKNRGVFYDPTGWMEIAEAPPPGPAERQAFSRAAKKLENAGLIVTIYRHGRRLTHLQPTARGLRVALNLNAEADLPAIREALLIAKWAGPEHLAAIDDAMKRQVDE